MGSGLSVTEEVRRYESTNGTYPLDRCGLSLETVATWTFSDVLKALRAVQSMENVNLLMPALEAVRPPDGVDGAYLLSVSEEALEALFTKVSLAPEELAHWATKTVLRIQRRQIIVGRATRPPPLPEGWKAVQSRSRPGELAFLNVLTGQRVKEMPTAKAERYKQPLPAGWVEVPSSRWPGTTVFLHVTNPGLRLKHRPVAHDPTLAHDYDFFAAAETSGDECGDGQDTRAQRRRRAEATHSNMKKAALRVMRGDLERVRKEKGAAKPSEKKPPPKKKLGHLRRRAADSHGCMDEEEQQHHREFTISVLQPRTESRRSRKSTHRSSSRQGGRSATTAATAVATAVT